MDMTKSNQHTILKHDSVVRNQDGTLCFTFGKTRIIVTEHFDEHGKQLSQLLAELVLQEARKLEDNSWTSNTHKGDRP